MDRFAFDVISTPPLPPKPRARGITAIIDKGLGPAAVTDLAETAGNWIDVVKFGWGTSRVQPEQVVRRKVDAYKSAGIATCTGGTLLEIAVAQNRFDDFLARAHDLGFAMVEVSNGVHPMSESEKTDFIAAARAKGFTVWSEVGRKDPEEDARLKPDERVAAVRREIEAGAAKVILEARESGTMGIYDAQGRPSVELLNRIVEAVPTEQLVFEAPQKSQQLWLMRSFGWDVNLGNVPPDDAISVATLRTGLRGDTFAAVHLPGIDVYLEMGINGAVAARERHGIVVLIDALRMSATVITAIAGGMAGVKPVATPEECQGEITAGERGGRKLPHTTHANSPTELIDRHYEGKQLVLTTSNGTECLLTADDPSTMTLIGTTLNARAVAAAALRLARERNAPITLLMAGRNNRDAIEDTLAAAEILHAMGSGARLHGPAPQSSAALEADFFAGDSGRNLVELGYSDDVRFCAQLDRFDVVPVYRSGLLVPLR